MVNTRFKNQFLITNKFPKMLKISNFYFKSKLNLNTIINYPTIEELQEFSKIKETNIYFEIIHNISKKFL